MIIKEKAIYHHLIQLLLLTLKFIKIDIFKIVFVYF